MSSVNSLIATSLRMQTIRRDPFIPESAKDKMVADLQKTNSLIVQTSEQQDDAAEKGTALGAVGPAGEVGASGVDGQTSSPAPAASAPRSSSVQSTGKIIDKLA